MMLDYRRCVRRDGDRGVTAVEFAIILPGADDSRRTPRKPRIKLSELQARRTSR